jgi:hypothetical protein
MKPITQKILLILAKIMVLNIIFVLLLLFVGFIPIGPYDLTKYVNSDTNETKKMSLGRKIWYMQALAGGMIMSGVVVFLLNTFNCISNAKSGINLLNKSSSKLLNDNTESTGINKLMDMAMKNKTVSDAAKKAEDKVNTYM